MPIDSSIYQNIRPVEAPDFMSTAKDAMTLSQMGMQRQQQQMQMQQQQALRQAYAQNTNPDGSINTKGVALTLGQLGQGQQAMEQMGQNAKYDESRAKADSANYDAGQQRDAEISSNLRYVLGADPSQRPALYQKRVQDLMNRGILKPNEAPTDYNESALQDILRQHQGSMPELKGEEIKSNIAKNNQEPFKTGAEELGKYKDDVANPSNKKVTGSLTDVINRADRIASLSNAGARPDETPQQRVARLNAIIPQVAKEFNVSLAAIMQGGVPSDALMKELGTDTMNSGRSEVWQKITNDPTGAQQAKFIQQMVGTAQHLRQFASGRMQDISQRSRAAYPYANKYFGKQMDDIQRPIAAPELSGQEQDSVLAGKGGLSLENSATASDKVGGFSLAEIRAELARRKGSKGK